MGSLHLASYSNVAVLTGAGISVASGLKPYRGPGGLWTEGGDVQAATAEGFAADPGATWRLMGPLREQAAAAAPNAAHVALAEAEQRATGSFLVVTQNVDGLHQRAGSENVVEVHGSIFRTRCSNTDCDRPTERDERYAGGLPTCDRCRAPLRPDVVLFGDAIDVDAEWTIKKALRDCDLFIAIGTSGTVSPASNYVRSAKYVGARTVLVNLEPMSPANPYFDEERLGPAEELVPQLFG
ncbi:MAG: NAD-dependent deacylase [Deltaproteobacteria bacterium]|nr:NAD-dependent deacylase [Deltaproteobacteria bacterium]